MDLGFENPTGSDICIRYAPVNEKQIRKEKKKKLKQALGQKVIESKCCDFQNQIKIRVDPIHRTPQ